MFVRIRIELYILHTIIMINITAVIAIIIATSNHLVINNKNFSLQISHACRVEL